LLGAHFIVELELFSDVLSLCCDFPTDDVKRQQQDIFFKMFSADYPPSPTSSEADMDAMTAHVENRPYHEAFMREAINMVRFSPPKSALLPDTDVIEKG
jgi:hypothetical protein